MGIETVLTEISKHGFSGLIIVVLLIALYKLFVRYEATQEKRAMEGMNFQADILKFREILERALSELREERFRGQDRSRGYDRDRE